MRAAPILVFLPATILLAQTLPSQKPVLPSIEGRTLDRAGVPVRKTVLSLRPVALPGGGPQKPYTTTSDAEGKFAITGIEPGEYQLWADHPSYLRTAYGARRTRTPGIGLVLAGDRPIKNLEIRLIPESVISGKLLDEDGEIFGRGRVLLMQTAYRRGRKAIEFVSHAAANQRGEFEIPGVAPGRYYLAADIERTAAWTDVAERQNEASGIYTVTYYPNAKDVASAVPIDVLDGQQVTGIKLRMRKGPLLHLRGKVQAGMPELAAARLHTTIWPEGRGIMGPPGALQFYSDAGKLDPNGGFDLVVTERGDYILAVTDSKDPFRILARQRVTVTRDVENLLITVDPPAAVTGSLTCGDATGTPARPPACGPTRILFLAAEGPSTNPPTAAMTGAGAFRLENVPAANYRLDLEPVPDGYYLKSVRVDGADTLGRIFFLGANSKIDVVLSPAAAQIRGVVEDKDAKPASGALVTIVPLTPNPELPSRYYLIATNQEGAFAVRVAPDAYRVLAWEDLDTSRGLQFDSDLMEANQSAGVTVKLGEDSVEQVKLTRIPAPR